MDKTMKPQTNQFLQVEFNLLSNTKLNFGQKVLISYILGWQSQGKICYESIGSLANRFGLKYEGLRSLKKSLTKFDFYSFTIEKEEINGNIIKHIQQIIDLEKLQAFLSSNDIPASNQIIEEHIYDVEATSTINEELTPITDIQEVPEPTKLNTRKKFNPVNTSDFETMMGEPLNTVIDDNSLDEDQPEMVELSIDYVMNTLNLNSGLKCDTYRKAICKEIGYNVGLSPTVNINNPKIKEILNTPIDKLPIL